MTRFLFTAAGGAGGGTRGEADVDEGGVELPGAAPVDDEAGKLATDFQERIERMARRRLL